MFQVRTGIKRLITLGGLDESELISKEVPATIPRKKRKNLNMVVHKGAYFFVVSHVVDVEVQVLCRIVIFMMIYFLGICVIMIECLNSMHSLNVVFFIDFSSVQEEEVVLLYFIFILFPLYRTLYFSLSKNDISSHFV